MIKSKRATAPQNEKRYLSKIIRFSPNEIAEIQNMADKMAGGNFSAYIRAMVLPDVFLNERTKK